MIRAYTGAHLVRSQAPTVEDRLGMLPDAVECTVQRDIDGLFELSMTYPVQGSNARVLQANNWISCDAGGNMGLSYFRIDQVMESIDGTMTVHASHASYNALTILAAPFSVHESGDFSSAAFYPWYNALISAVNSIDTAQLGGFSVGGYTDTMLVNPAAYTQPVTLKQAVLDAIKDRPQIYLTYYTFGLRLWQYMPVGSAPDFRIRYGKDMVSFSSSVDATDFYTHVMPYYMVDDVMQSHNMDVYALEGLPSQFSGYRRIKAINLADYYDGLDTAMDLNTIQIIIDRWLEDNPWNPLPDEISVESVPQEGNEFELGNIGKIYYTPTGTVYTAYVVSLTYDVLAGRVTAIGINQRQKDVTDTIASLVQR